MTFGTQTGWTDERLAILRQDHADDMAFSLIAHDINQKTGSVFSRNAVIGKAKRLGLKSSGPRRYRAANMTHTPRSRTAPVLRRNGGGFVLRAAQAHAAPEIESIEQTDATATPSVFLGIPLLKLEENHCRYPRTVEGVHLFCGQEKMRESGYCRSCHRLCHNPAQSPNRYGFSGSWKATA